MSDELLDDRDATPWQDEGDARNEADERDAELADDETTKIPEQYV